MAIQKRIWEDCGSQLQAAKMSEQFYYIIKNIMCKRYKKSYSSQLSANEASDVVEHNGLNTKRDRHSTCKRTPEECGLSHLAKRRLKRRCR